MKRMRMAAATALALGGLAVGSMPAQADSPPSSWTNGRTLVCDGQTVETALTPAGFGTPFHVLGTTEVLVPKIVKVIFPDETDYVTTVQVPGFEVQGADTVHCTYTDPAGLYIDMIALRR